MSSLWEVCDVRQRNIASNYLPSGDPLLNTSIEGCVCTVLELEEKKSMREHPSAPFYAFRPVCKLPACRFPSSRREKPADPPSPFGA